MISRVVNIILTCKISSWLSTHCLEAEGDFGKHLNLKKKCKITSCFHIFFLGVVDSVTVGYKSNGFCCKYFMLCWSEPSRFLFDVTPNSKSGNKRVSYRCKRSVPLRKESWTDEQAMAVTAGKMEVVAPTTFWRFVLAGFAPIKRNRVSSSGLFDNQASVCGVFAARCS